MLFFFFFFTQIFVLHVYYIKYTLIPSKRFSIPPSQNFVSSKFLASINFPPSFGGKRNDADAETRHLSLFFPKRFKQWRRGGGCGQNLFLSKKRKRSWNFRGYLLLLLSLRERKREREVTGDFLLLLLVGGGNILARDGWGCTGNQDSFSCSGIRRLTEATYPTVLILDGARGKSRARKSRIFDPSTESNFFFWLVKFWKNFKVSFLPPLIIVIIIFPFSRIQPPFALDQ